jgi:polo-like kinase 4
LQQQTPSFFSISSATSNHNLAKNFSNFSNMATKKVHIPGVGTAIELSQGVVQIHYSDGSKLSVIPPNQGGGVTYSQFGGANQHFSSHDEIPRCVQDRLAQLPTVKKYLLAASNASTPLTHHNRPLM